MPGRVGGDQSRMNCFHHTIKISINVRIPESQNLKTLRRKRCIAHTIFGKVSFSTMLPAIRLDDEALFETYEVNDVRPDWRLPAKVKAKRPERAQLHP